MFTNNLTCGCTIDFYQFAKFRPLTQSGILDTRVETETEQEDENELLQLYCSPILRTPIFCEGGFWIDCILPQKLGFSKCMGVMLHHPYNYT